MKKLVATLLLATPFLSIAQTTPPKVTILAKGHDVRQILGDVFAQAKKSCVIQQNIGCPLYITLEDTTFDQALDIICKQANLGYDLDKGVYYIHKALPKPAIIAKPSVARALVPEFKEGTSIPPLPPIERPIGKLPEVVLQHRLTTRLSKTPIKIVLDSFAEQTGVTIELDHQVPAYKLDAFLLNTSLKYALDEVTKAAGLIYKLTDHQTILVSAPESKVALAQ